MQHREMTEMFKVCILGGVLTLDDVAILGGSRPRDVDSKESIVRPTQDSTMSIPLRPIPKQKI
eukprot:2577858-Amphidinium_carterae.1